MRLTYSAQGSGHGSVFAQILDGARGLVLGDQVAPIRIRLDGARHTIGRSLDAVAASVKRSSRLTLQIIGGTAVHGPVRTTAVVRVRSARIALPTVARRATRPRLTG